MYSGQKSTDSGDSFVTDQILHLLPWYIICPMCIFTCSLSLTVVSLFIGDIDKSVETFLLLIIVSISVQQRLI